MSENGFSGFDRLCMRRALRLAAQGAQGVAPNPMVGCVIARGGRVLAEGYHARYGEGHAEANALRWAREQGVDLEGATLYVTLEPCTHTGKTPPCCEAILGTAIGRVVIATLDPNPRVNGGSVPRLEQAGKQVQVGLMEEEAMWLNRRFFTAQISRRPYVVLKWAQTEDGFIDSTRRADEPAPWITNARCKALVHRWRTEEMAILVGGNTVARDNPQLTVREWAGPNPLRVTVDRRLRLPADSHLLDGQYTTLILANGEEATRRRAAGFVGREGVEIAHCDFGDGLAATVLQELFSRGVHSVLVEGGGTVLNAFLEAGLWDEARVFIGPRSFGSGVVAPPLPLGFEGGQRIGDSSLFYFVNAPGSRE